MKKQFFKSIVGSLFSLLMVSCNSKITSEVDSLIRFYADGDKFNASVTTKTSETTDASLESNGFYVSASTGAEGSDESAVFTSAKFNKSGDTWAADHYWPTSDLSYHFAASNITLAHTATGATISASNSTDVVCAYLSNPDYKGKNTLSFQHIFARIGTVAVSAANGYTISGLTIKLIPKVSGTYNLYMGNGHTDGTGWSAMTDGNETTIASSIGNNTNDLYLVPGTYTLIASWTATQGAYNETFSDKECMVEITGGKINTISATFTGRASGIQFGVSTQSWGENEIVLELL